MAVLSNHARALAVHLGPRTGPRLLWHWPIILLVTGCAQLSAVPTTIAVTTHAAPAPAVSPVPAVETPDVDVAAAASAMRQQRDGSVAAHPTDLWAQLRQEMHLPASSERAEVREAVRAYARDRDVGRVLSGRGAWLLPLVVSEARLNRVPVELAFLPFVESKLNPTASNAGNVGMWQFQGGTARGLGLQTGPGIDERKDPVRSTRAAYKYLRRLYEIFDDWMLALVAYNIGDGRLQRMLARSNSRDIWQLPLPAHTRVHMAKLAALWTIARDPQASGIRLPPINGDLSVERLQLSEPTGLQELAEARGVANDAVLLFNPQLGAGRLPSGTVVWLPRRGAADTLAGGDAVDAAPPAARPSGNHAGATTARVSDERALTLDAAGNTEYRVRLGDTLYTLARRFGVRVDDLKTRNELRSSNLRIDQRLIIPAP